MWLLPTCVCSVMCTVLSDDCVRRCLLLPCVLTCCYPAVFQWYLILGGAIFLMVSSSAQPPAGGAGEQS